LAFLRDEAGRVPQPTPSFRYDAREPSPLDGEGLITPLSGRSQPCPLGPRNGSYRTSALQALATDGEFLFEVAAVVLKSF
jgi:hypothetical protein